MSKKEKLTSYYLKDYKITQYYPIWVMISSIGSMHVVKQHDKYRMWIGHYRKYRPDCILFYYKNGQFIGMLDNDFSASHSCKIYINVKYVSLFHMHKYLHTLLPLLDEN